MIVRHLHTVHALLSVLAQPTLEMQTLRTVLTVDGRFPTRRTWERRLRAIPTTLPTQIRCLGQALVALIQPWATCGRAAAIDSTLCAPTVGYGTSGIARLASSPTPRLIPRRTGPSRAGTGGSTVKLHLVTTVAGVWIPLAADLTAANVADNVQALTLLPELPAEVRYVLGDQHYNDPALDAACNRVGRTVVATHRGPYPHTDDGVGGRLKNCARGRSKT